MKNRIQFHRSNLNQFGNLQAQFSDILCEYLASGKDFEIAAKYIKESKSNLQCAGIHKLCSLLIPRFSECFGVEFDIESVKTNIKLYFNYVRKATHQECIAEAIKEKARKKSLGQSITVGDFQNLVKTFENRLEYPKSFADATKEEMMELIKKIEELGKRMGWDEIKLESSEVKALLEYYNNK